MKESTLLIVLSVCLIILILIIIVVNRPNFIPKTIEDISYQTRFSPTYFEIYDKSTDNVCNRLILVKPFEWVILANVGHVIILNDTIFECPIGDTPSVMVPSFNPQIADVEESINFRNVCLKGNFAQILISYQTVAPVFVKFDIEDGQEPNKFTILDALNILFKNYITMDPEIDIFHKNSNRADFKIKHVPNPLLLHAKTKFAKNNDQDTTMEEYLQAKSNQINNQHHRYRTKRSLHNMSVVYNESGPQTLFHPKKLQKLYETTELARKKKVQMSIEEI